MQVTHWGRADIANTCLYICRRASRRAVATYRAEPKEVPPEGECEDVGLSTLLYIPLVIGALPRSMPRDWLATRARGIRRSRPACYTQHSVAVWLKYKTACKHFVTRSYERIQKPILTFVWTVIVLRSFLCSCRFLCSATGSDT